MMNRTPATLDQANERDGRTGKESPCLHRQIYRVPHLAAAGTTIQTREAVLRELSIDYFLLVFVRCGKRTVQRGANVCVAGPGQGILMTPGVYDVVNVSQGPDAYRSDWLAWDLDLAVPPGDSRHSEQPAVEGAKLLPLVDASLEDGFAAARKALESSDRLPHAIVRHRVLEVPLWLREQGLHLVPPGTRSLGARIREMVRDDPSAAWNATSLTAVFSMSEATLRRRLGAEGTSVTQLISDARMWCAMAMLQSTDLPISRIALDCGYASASRFAARFRIRFGFAPAEVRGRRC